MLCQINYYHTILHSSSSTVTLNTQTPHPTPSLASPLVLIIITTQRAETDNKMSHQLIQTSIVGVNSLFYTQVILFLLHTHSMA